jgi:hydroxymethylglutaryl-CoA lyase
MTQTDAKELVVKERAYVREAGLRDGIQMAKNFVSTDQKISWCRAEAAAGVREIEVTSFVPPAIVPQFSDAVDVVKAALEIPDLTVSALVPNLKGAQRAFDAGIHKINFVVSASEQHNLANVRRTTEQSINEFRLIASERRERGLDVVVAGGIATVYGCTIQGDVPEKRVYEIAEALAEAGADEIILADTVGYGGPAQVRRIVPQVSKLVGSLPIISHFHDTRGLGLANVTAAIDVGVRRFDASLAGLGGCPFAPGATGNINIEDCVFLLETMGFDTGIDIDALIALRLEVEPLLPEEKFFGMMARAGLPKTFAR